jgi:hypothetical protein
MNDWKTKIKQAWNDNPLAVIAIAALAATAAAKVMDANTQRQNAKVWAREVDRRVMVRK